LILGILIRVERANNRSRITDDLRAKAGTIARRLSSELLVGERGNIDPVVAGLRQELSVDTIVLLPEGIDCGKNAGTSPCDMLTDASYVWLTERLPHIPNDRHVFVGQSKTLIATAFPWSTLAVSVLLLLAILLVGVILQWSSVRRHILKPTNDLLDSGAKNVDPSQWPIEIRRINNKLQSLLEERDRAIREAHRLKTETLVHDLSQRILHDLKSPLGTLGMMIETDLKQVPAETKDAIRRVLNRIRAIVDTNLKEYSADVLASTSVPATTSVEAIKPASTIGGAVRMILDEETAKARSRDITITADLPRQIYHTFAPITFSELCRVFSNLIVNAVDAAEQGQKKIYITAHRTDDYCDISIRDFGKGFDPAALKRIQEGKQGSTKQNGTGLGLLTAKTLVEQAGGQLNISSLAGGAIVRVRLPILDTPPWFHDITHTTAKTILALDDDSTMIRQLKSIFPEKHVELFQQEDEFLAATSRDDSALALVDYDFGGNRTGLDLITGHGLTRRAVLLSGRIAFDPKIRASAEASGVRMYPKECLAREEIAHDTH
jgi:signal transduction histidine kinase